MRADAVSVLNIFEKKMRLEVPLFQRQYVWNREKHWEPLWEDIERKFYEYVDGRTDAPVHFLGAMVLDQKQTPTTHVERRQVIDGQQRLTTLQLFLAAFRDLCTKADARDLAKETERFTLNQGMMNNPDEEKFKVWPTFDDRNQFAEVMTTGSLEVLEERFPERRGRKKLDRPAMVSAYLFFREMLDSFFFSTSDTSAHKSDSPLNLRLEAALQALRDSLKVVVIDLEPGDDAQVIFETLNSRGEPLLPADLLRNFIFLRAARQKEPLEPLYEKYWKPFDDKFWRKEVKQGRLTRPRSDLFLQHFLAGRQFADIPVRHLFVEYKFWIQRQRPFQSVQHELETLARHRTLFRRILEPKTEDVIYPLVEAMDAFDVRTLYPLLLILLDAELSDEEWTSINVALESYIVRRGICGLTTKNYNRVFLGLAESVHTDPSPAQLIRHLAGLEGPSVEWPSDDAFAGAWLSSDMYTSLRQARVAHILKRLNEDFFDSKVERFILTSKLSIEHLLPQEWITNWKLPDGSSGLRASELVALDPADERAIATLRRNGLVHKIGNLTLVTQPLNSTASNAAWEIKKEKIRESSILPLNRELQDAQNWDEQAIGKRSAALLERARRIWPRVEPSQS
jgi:uncharacterized protein with ParB-like and HNH nuclease domain